MATFLKGSDEEMLTCPNPPLIKYQSTLCRPRSQSILPQWLLTKDLITGSNNPSSSGSRAGSKPARKDNTGRSRPILNFLKKKE